MFCSDKTEEPFYDSFPYSKQFFTEPYVKNILIF